jgi:hypothetical protein
MFERVLAEQERDIGARRELYPVSGSRRGRHLLDSTLGRLGVEAWNRHSAHARAGASAIDLVSDHAGYIVNVDIS